MPETGKCDAFLFSGHFGLVTTTETALCQSTQLAFNELLAEWRDTVDKHLTVEVVELMLHNTSQIPLNPLVVVLKVLVIPLYVDTGRTCNLLVDSRD
jgi:hypothetical protein